MSTITPVLAPVPITRTLFQSLPDTTTYTSQNHVHDWTYNLSIKLDPPPLVFPIFTQVGNLCDPFLQILPSCRTFGCLTVSSHSTPQIISRTHPVLSIFHCQYSRSGPHLSSLWIRKKLLFDLCTFNSIPSNEPNKLLPMQGKCSLFCIPSCKHSI